LLTFIFPVFGESAPGPFQLKFSYSFTRFISMT
jgi:hypothetical protein